MTVIAVIAKVTRDRSAVETMVLQPTYSIGNTIKVDRNLFNGVVC